MKNRMLFLLTIGACLSMSSVAKNDYQPPGKEQLQIVDAPKMEVNFSFNATEYAFENFEITVLTESVSEAMPVSATVCPQVTQKVADVELHDFGNDLHASLVGYQKQSSNTLLFDRLYLTNCSIRQCFC